MRGSCLVASPNGGKRFAALQRAKPLGCFRMANVDRGNRARGWKVPKMRSVIVAAFLGGLVIGFFAGRQFSPSVVINEPNKTAAALPYPWIDVKLSYSPSGESPDPSKPIINEITVGFYYVNRGSGKALNMTGKVEIAGR